MLSTDDVVCGLEMMAAAEVSIGEPEGEGPWGCVGASVGVDAIEVNVGAMVLTAFLAVTTTAVITPPQARTSTMAMMPMMPMIRPTLLLRLGGGGC